MTASDELAQLCNRAEGSRLSGRLGQATPGGKSAAVNERWSTPLTVFALIIGVSVLIFG
jgi:hypothetical protein